MYLPVGQGVLDVVTGGVHEHTRLIPGSTLQFDVLVDCTQVLQLPVTDGNNCKRNKHKKCLSFTTTVKLSVLVVNDSTDELIEEDDVLCLLMRATCDISEDHTTNFTLEIFTEARDLQQYNHNPKYFLHTLRQIAYQLGTDQTTPTSSVAHQRGSLRQHPSATNSLCQRRKCRHSLEPALFWLFHSSDF